MEQLEYLNTMNENEDIDVGKDPYIDDRGEILNYYFIHLQILARKFKKNTRFIQTLYGKFSVFN